MAELSARYTVYSGKSGVKLTERELKVLFIGSVVPDTVEFRTPAFSRAGNLAQQGLLDGMADAGAQLKLLSFQPVPAFPRSRQLTVLGRWLGGRHQQRTLPFLNLPYLKQISLAGGILFAGMAAIRQQRPDYLMSYNVNSFVSGPLGVLSKAFHIPYIPVVYDVDVPGSTVPDGLYQRWEYAWARRVLPRLRGAVVGTALIGHNLMPGRPRVIVEGGLNWSQQQYAPGTPTQDPTFDIVFAGALERYNGIDVMLEALQHLPSDVRLHIAGQGALKSAVEAAAVNDPRIIYHGLLDMAGLRTLYAQGDLLINHRSDLRLDSRYVFPSKLIEYLASGLPVLSTRFRSLPDDYLPFMGVIADESSQALAQAVRDVMGEPHTAWNRAARGREFVIAHKAWAIQGRRILDFLEMV